MRKDEIPTSKDKKTWNIWGDRLSMNDSCMKVGVIK